jgi:hypothetical protein
MPLQPGQRYIKSTIPALQKISGWRRFFVPQSDLISTLTHIADLLEIIVVRAFLLVILSATLWKVLKKEISPSKRANASTSRASGEQDRSP